MSLSPSTALEVSVAMDTDIGQKRKQNQDAIGHLSPTDPDVLNELGQIFVLADGVGGLAGGDLASQYAVSTIISSYYDQEEGDPPERLARAIAEANNVIYAEGHGQDAAVMATTVVTAVIRDRELIIGSVGDSPAYLMRDAAVRKLTLDHNLENQQREAGTPLDDGDPDGRKLVRALGSQPSVKVDIISGKVRGGDYVVLCSDGLTRYIPADEIEQTVATLPVERASKALIEIANERGGADNISVIVLRLAEDENLTQLPPIPDPMESWGRSRRIDRARFPAAPHAERVKRPTLPANTLLRDVWGFMRGNTVITGVGMSVLLIVFVIIMLVIATAGGDENAKSGERADTPLPPPDRTATSEVVHLATAQVAAAATNDAIQAATAAEVVRRTLTPPTPIPTFGPMLAAGLWFRVLDGDPILAYQSAGQDSDPATPLESGQSFRVSVVDRETTFGPWYQIVDNLGAEIRWVNAPSLYARVVVVDTAGNPLPDSQQPVDVPPPGQRRATSTPTTSPAPTRTPTPAPTIPGTPGTPATVAPTPTPSETPVIPYGVENWEIGQDVTLKADLDLCRVPDVDACDAGEATSGETGVVVNEPVASGDHWWWEVEFQDGRSGWIAQVLLGIE